MSRKDFTSSPIIVDPETGPQVEWDEKTNGINPMYNKRGKYEPLSKLNIIPTFPSNAPKTFHMLIGKLMMILNHLRIQANYDDIAYFYKDFQIICFVFTLREKVWKIMHDNHTRKFSNETMRLYNNFEQFCQAFIQQSLDTWGENTSPNIAQYFIPLRPANPLTSDDSGLPIHYVHGIMRGFGKKTFRLINEDIGMMIWRIDNLGWNVQFEYENTNQN